MSQQRIHLVEGDLLPELGFKWEGQDITGFTLKFHVKRNDGTRFTRTPVVDNVGDGANIPAEFHVEWLPGDLVRGNHKAELEVFDTSSKNETFTGIFLQIEKDIA